MPIGSKNRGLIGGAVLALLISVLVSLNASRVAKVTVEPLY